MAKPIITVMVFILSLFQWPLALALSLDGVTGFASVFELNSATRGVVKSIHVKAGQLVSKGQVLIELDSVPHKARLDKARANEKALLPEVEIAQLELERVQELYDIDSLSQVDLKNAENKLSRAEGAYQAAQADTILASYQLQQTMIRAPVDGRVLQLQVNLEQYIDPAESADTLITIVDSKRMKAIGMLDSKQWNVALINKAATIKYREQAFKGKVSYLGLSGNRQSGGQLTYAIHIDFETGQLLPAEMPVTINIKD